MVQKPGKSGPFKKYGINKTIPVCPSSMIDNKDIFDIDLSKQTIFPLSHIIVNNVTIQEQVLNFNITVMSMDIVDQSKDEVTDVFVGNNNEQDIINTQLAVVNKLVGLLSKGDLYRDKYQMDGDASCEFFYERFENQMAGVACTFDVLISNDTVSYTHLTLPTILLV